MYFKIHLGTALALIAFGLFMIWVVSKLGKGR
jgi:flagellar biogenesis protein FliO